MVLITANKPKIDLATLPFVKEVWCFYDEKFVIYLECEEGYEKKLFDSLPKWIHDTMKVSKGRQNVFLTSKK